MNYKDLENCGKETIKCLVCSHFCELGEQQIGKCKVRKNENGVIKSMVYGKVAAVSVDPVEREQFYHVLPSSFSYVAAPDGCNLTCPFCGTYESRKRTKRNDKIDMMPEEVVNEAIEYGCSSIAYGYSEPTVYIEYVLDTAEIAKNKGLKNLFSTNGFMTGILIKKMTGLIDAVNLDIKSFSADKYRNVLNADLAVVRNNLECFMKSDIWVEITTLIVPGFNDSIKELSATAKSIAQIDKNIPWHLKHFFPAHKYKNSYPTPAASVGDAYMIGKDAGLRYLYSACEDEAADTVCPSCDKTLIVRRNRKVIENYLNNGKCPECRRNIPGIW